MNMLWPFLFGFAFYRFGSTRVLRTALVVIYGATVIRMIFGLVNYYAGQTYSIPIINYSIDPQDLRAWTYPRFGHCSLRPSFAERFWQAR